MAGRARRGVRRVLPTKGAASLSSISLRPDLGVSAAVEDSPSELLREFRGGRPSRQRGPAGNAIGQATNIPLAPDHMIQADVTLGKKT